MRALPAPETLDALRRDRRIGYYFRYRLHPGDFHPLFGADGRVLGHYAAKPLYDRLTREGRVDRRAGYSGRVAVLFLPPEAEARPRLIFARMPPERVRSGGRRNWPAIRAAAEAALHRALAA